MAKYREDLHTCKNELKGGSEVVKGCRDSLLALEKEKEYADLERDRAKADLEKAKAALQEQDRAFHAATQERDMLKGELDRMGERLARAREEAVQEYKEKFKDTGDYLDLMRDVVADYKMALKKADRTFDADYYNNLILGEPLTLASEDPIGFKQLDPIGTPGVTAE